jgi:hypothetical protein
VRESPIFDGAAFWHLIGFKAKTAHREALPKDGSNGGRYEIKDEGEQSGNQS